MRSLILILGIIPAGAGLTPLRALFRTGSRDHPRGCGAHCRDPAPCRSARGSSPRVRGSLRLSSSGSSDGGIIPAGAGLTCVSSSFSSALRDHPRGCGAHFRQRSSGRRCRGSSPRVRGSPLQGQRLVCISGIIPAGAGLTHFVCLPLFVLWDHPRGCGAHLFCFGIIAFFTGSSPRVRGSH